MLKQFGHQAQAVFFDKHIAFAGEVGLSGEVRAVARIEQRILEAEKLGFNAIMISKYNKGIQSKANKIELVQIGKIEEAFEYLFG